MSGPRYSIIPAGAVVDPRLEGRDLQVLALLGIHANDLGWCRRSQVTMARQLACARSTIQSALRRLVEAGWLEQRTGTRRSGGDAAHWYRVRLDVTAADMAAAGATTLLDEAGDDLPPPDEMGLDGFAEEAFGGEDFGPEEAADGAAPGPAGGAGPGAAPMLTTPFNDPCSKPSPQPPRGRERRGSRDDRDDGRRTGSGGSGATPSKDFDEAGFSAFFERWLAASDKHRHDSRSQAFAVWKGLGAADRAAAGRDEAITTVVTEQRRNGRKSFVAAKTYLREKFWERGGGDASAPAGYRTLAPWSRVWWARWWWLVRLGAKDADGNRLRAPQVAAAMVDSARRNLAVGETETEAARLEAVAASFVYVLVGSNEFGAWKAHWRHRGIDLPKPDHADRIFMPSLWPPDEGGEVMEFAGLEG